MNYFFRSVNEGDLFLSLLKERHKRLSQKLKIYQHFIPGITKIATRKYRSAKKAFYSNAAKVTLRDATSSGRWSYLWKMTKGYFECLNTLDDILNFRLFHHRLLETEMKTIPQTDDEIMDMLEMCQQTEA